ncbi:AraC family transcriptional regulator [Chitinophaga agrisoli]|uniref:AraC family transcriptional regulator n=1 Tax=Chitinophaga agrisoli TaxID=2607653 RepID=A0A5B2VS97_9BACT|nr:helix-turn-helix domain-containing protein [Chitinophaga agrisoli]KAA2241508.1 AraC family transcriptional regulator [Chitinophaga agrisoli]
MFHYKEIPTPDPIQTYIRKFWVLDHSNSPLYSHAKYALPNGCLTLAFITGQGVLLEDGNKTINIKTGIYLIGQITRRLKVIIKPYSKAIMAQLNPWTPTLITKLPLSELTNHFATLNFVNKKLHKAFSAIDTSDENLLVKKIYHELESLFYETSDSSLIQNVINVFTASFPAKPVKMSDIAADTGYSKRYIEKKFNLHTGLSPKEMYSILRVRNIINALHRPNNKSLTQLALEFGYFDQSHFIKMYTGIMDSSPRRFETNDYILPFN